MALKVRVSHCKSAPCLFHGSSAGGDIMYLICNVAFYDQLIEGSCKFMGGSILQYLTTLISFQYKYCDNGDATFLICHVTYREHMFKGLYELWVEFLNGESSPCHVCWPLVQSKWRLKYIICHVTSRNHVIEGSSNFISWSSSWYVTTLPRLVVICIVV